MRRFLLLIGVATVASCGDPLPQGPRQRGGARDDCTPAKAGLADASAVELAPPPMPSPCRFPEDDDPMLRVRRSVTTIRSETELLSLCRVEPGQAAGANRIDFSTKRLLSVRIPHSTHLGWAVEREGTVTVGEVRTPCEIGPPQPLRYNLLVPATATVAFHLCTSDMPCGEE